MILGKRLLQFIALTALCATTLGQTPIMDPLGKGDLVYTKSDSLFCDTLGFLGGDPCHVGTFIPGNTVIEAIDNEGDSVRSTTYDEFRSRGTSPNGFRGSRTLVNSPSNAQRDTIAAYLSAKNARLTYYDDNHLNQKGGYAGGCGNGVSSCFDGFDYFNEFDCVGIAERAYEVAGLNPTPSEGVLLFPEEQFFSASMTYPSVTLSNSAGFSTSVRSGYWKFFAINVPSGKDKFSVVTSNGTGDLDLYVKRSFFPSSTSSDCSSASAAFNEQCTFNSPLSGVWGIGVYGYGPGTLGFGVQAAFAKQPTASWITPPPSTMVSGQQYQVSWSSTGDYDHINVHWNPTDPTASGCCLGAVSSTNSSTSSPASSPVTITAPTTHNGNAITGPVTVKYVVHARHTGTQIEAYSAVATVTVVPPDTPPNTSITGGPSGTIQFRDVSFNYTGTDNATPVSSLQYAYRLDPLESSFSGYSSQTFRNYTGLANGPYTFYVRARDQAGNVDPTPASRSFDVQADSTSPETSISSGPSGTVATGDVTFIYTGSDSVTPVQSLQYAYRLDPIEGSFSAYSSQTSRSYGLGPGSYTFYVKARDQAGNVDQSPASRSFTVAIVDPTCTYSFTPPSATGSGSGGTGNVQVTGSPSGCTGSWSASSSEGWLSLTGTSGGNGSGSWQVPYAFTANPSTTAVRSANITFTGAFQGGGPFTLNQSIGPSSGYVRGDFNADGKADILWRHAGSGTDYVWFMNGATQIGASYITAVTDPNWRIIGTGDFNADGKSDIAWRHAVSGVNYLWYMNGVTQIGASYLPALSDANWNAVAIADFNLDGRSDIVWRHTTSGEIRMWLMSNAALSASVTLGWLPDALWRIEGAGDMNGDIHPDIVWRHYGSGTNYVWFMSGSTQIGASYLPGVPDTTWDIEGVADYDGNGSADLVWRQYTTGTDYIWFMTGTSHTGASYLPGIPDSAWRMCGPR